MNFSDTIPAHDSAAEIGVLGSMLIDSRACEIAAEDLTESDFYSDVHRIIFSHICAVFQSVGSVDELSARSALSRSGQLDAVGGSDYLGRLLIETPSAANVEQYCDLVRERAERRKIVELAQQIQSAVSTMGDNGEILELIQRKTELLVAQRLKIAKDPQDLHGLAVSIAADAINGEARDYWGAPCGVGGTVIDDLIGGFSKNEYIVLAARTSMGKSTFVMSLARGVADKNPNAGMPLFISTEMSFDGMARKALAAAAGLPTKALLKRNLTDGQKRTVQNIIDNKNLAGVQVAYAPGATIQQIKAIAKRHKRKHGLPILIIDLAGGLTGHGESERVKFGSVSKGLAALKVELETCIIACVQVSRAVFMNGDKRPDLKDLKETGAWEEDADRVIFLHRPAYFSDSADKRTEIIQAKDRENGDVRSAMVEYLPARGCFSPA